MAFGNVKAERKAIEMTYLDVCKIERSVKTETDGITKHSFNAVYENVKCALSNSSVSAEQTDKYNDVVYSAKLFLPPDIDVYAGDKVTVIVEGRTVKFENMSAPALFPTHQVVFLKEVNKN
jgi:hypothetical protein